MSVKVAFRFVDVRTLRTVRECPATDPHAFRPKKKIGQIYVNIPGRGRFYVQAEGADPTCLDAALVAAGKAFLGRVRRAGSREKYQSRRRAPPLFRRKT